MWRKVLLVVAVCSLVGGSIFMANAHSKSAVAATGPATAASSPASAPAEVLATVGKTEITSAMFNRMLRNAPPGLSEQQIAEARGQFRDKMIFRQLIAVYVDAKNVQPDQKDVDAQLAEVAKAAEKRGATREQFMDAMGITMDDLRMDLRINKCFSDATSKEKTAAYIKAHPEYFDGSRVTASHILLTCSPVDPTDKVKEAHDQLAQIAADIQAGKITFEDAAKKFSKCPSKDKGGDLGDFAFGPDPATGAGMVLPFCRAAYALKEGQISPVFRTQFGWHIVKVTKRTAPATRPAEPNEKVAQEAMLSELQDEVLAQTLKDQAIVIKK